MATFPDTPVDASTLFMVGSTTKAFTAAAMSFLVDDNDHYPDIQWDTPVSKIIRDDFVLEEDYFTTHVTIEDTLTHRAGMPRHDMSYGGHYNGHYVTSKDVVRSLRYLPLTAELRTKAQYCNMMYVVASHIIETLTGSWLGDVIRTRILEPLDMKSTYFSATAARKAPEHFAQGYYYVNGTYYEAPDMELYQVAGAGFIISNVLDYTKWIRAWIDQAPPISKAGHRALRTPRTLFTEFEDDSPWTGPFAYSLGWFNTVYKGHEVFWHTGGMEAFGALVVIMPDIRYGIVGFGNIAARSNSVEEILIWHLVEERLGIKEDQRYEWDKKYVH
jgi:CubicO group peptidase (beta-lactamase class C family)